MISIQSDHHYYFITKKNFFMRKSFVVLLAILISAGAMAQKGKNYLGGGADLSLPLGVFADDFNRGVGFYVKGLLEIKKGLELMCRHGEFVEENDLIFFQMRRQTR